MKLNRANGRRATELRKLEIVRGYTKFSPGSVLIRMGDTAVLCTASVDEEVPEWLAGKGQGWVTAEYDMLPGSTGRRRSSHTPGCGFLRRIGLPRKAWRAGGPDFRRHRFDTIASKGPRPNRYSGLRPHRGSRSLCVATDVAARRSNETYPTRCRTRLSRRLLPRAAQRVLDEHADRGRIWILEFFLGL